MLLRLPRLLSSDPVLRVKVPRFRKADKIIILTLIRTSLCNIRLILL